MNNAILELPWQIFKSFSNDSAEDPISSIFVVTGDGSRVDVARGLPLSLAEHIRSCHEQEMAIRKGLITLSDNSTDPLEQATAEEVS